MKRQKHVQETYRISSLVQTMLSLSIFLLSLARLGEAQTEGPRQHALKPFHLIGNIYYVGLSNNTSFLITTPQGHILLDPTEEAFVPDISRNIEQLGFHVKDIKIILNAHAHTDHVGGLAAFKELTGAKVLVMAEDAPVIADGGRSDFRSDGKEQWKLIKADQILHDGEQVRLGNATMVARLTPGHTKGCTTWTTVAEENGQKYNVVFVCSMGLGGGVPLIGNKKYPTVAEDYVKSFNLLRSLPCDVFSVSHAGMFNLDGKMKRMEQGTGPNPFIDPDGYRAFIDLYEGYFKDELKKQQDGAPPTISPPGRTGGSRAN